VATFLRTFRPWRAVLTAALALGLVTAAPVAAGTKVGGDPDTLSYFEGVVSDWQHVPGARATEYGLFYLFYAGGTAVNFRWGTTHPPGFRAAKANITYWLDGGKIVGYLASVTAHDIPRLKILVVAGKVYVSTTNCWERSTPASAPFGTGERVLVTDANGRFEPMTRQGDNTVVKYRYAWSNGSNAVQTDTISPGSPSTIRSKIVVKGKENFKVSVITKPLKRRPPLPVKNTGSAKPPMPAPFCKSAS
jgi:hypothetical protein